MSERMVASSCNCMQWQVGVRQSQMVYMSRLYTTPSYCRAPIRPNWTSMFQWQARRVCLLHLLKHLYGWCFFYVPATKIHQVSTMFLLWPHIWQMSHFAIFQQQTHEICLYCPSLHLDNVFLNSAVVTSLSSRIDACQTRKFKAGYTWCTLVLYYWTIQWIP